MAQAPEKQSVEWLQSLMSSEGTSFNGTLSQEEKEKLLKTQTTLLTLRAEEDELEKKKTETKEKFVAKLGFHEGEGKRLASIREEVDAIGDPMEKEIMAVYKKIDANDKKLNTCTLACQRKEMEYKESLHTWSDLNKEKLNLLTTLSELRRDSIKMRMALLDYLSKSLETNSVNTLN